MKLALTLIITIAVIVALITRPLRRYKWIVLGAYAVMVICLFAFYNVRTIDLILPFYHPTNQLFYQSDFLEEEEVLYPDALLPYLLENKNVYLPAYMMLDGLDVNTDEVWQNGQMLGLNIKNILESCGANVITGQMYPIIDENKVKELFTDFGCLNDTFRYSFFHNNLEGEYGNAFYYYWFYGASSEPFNLYLYNDGVCASDDLILLFDDNTNVYLVPSNIYEQKKEEW